MKKLALFSVIVSAFFVENPTFAGALRDARLSTCKSPLANECWLLGNGNNSYLECDDDTGDVPDDAVVFKYKDFRSRKCNLETTGDYWGPFQNINFCGTNAVKCGGSSMYKYFKDLPNGDRVCSKHPIETIASNIYGTYEYFCRSCQNGYLRAMKNYNKGCSSCNIKDTCVPEEMIDCLEAAASGQTANWNGTKCSCGNRDGVKWDWNPKTKRCEAGQSENNPKTCEEKYKGNQAAIDCCKAGESGINAYWSDAGKCECWNKDGSTYEWDAKAKKCKKRNAGSGPVSPVPQKNCKDKCGKSDTVCRACCDVIDTNEATYDSKAKKCDCLDGKEFKIDATSGKGQCVVKEVPPVVEDGECEYYFTGSIECANGNQYFEKTKIKLPKSKVGKECGTDILKNDVERVMELMKTLCKENNSDIIIVPGGPSSSEVDQAQSVLSAFTATAKNEASVWKTAEGKFNTTRLASDITAGVVLGTVGGVITGNVIKKNQVKKGFEALHCTVGGQKVADWGDEFSVGLQR